MGNTDSSEEDYSSNENDPNNEDTVEVVKVFQPQKLRQELENVVKHRIPSPTREAGDGMEAGKEFSSSTKSSPRSVAEESVKLIKLPKTNISLSKLPPITDDKVKLPVTEPTSPLVLMQATYTCQKPAFQGIRQNKEPRFVPYEPYKAAITPLTSGPCTKKKNSKGNTSEKVVKTETTDETDASVTNNETVTSNHNHDVIVNETFIPKETEEKYLRGMNDLKLKLEETEKQLRIQIQVNSEVKKLLVASVGEDIEAKVDFLTQDKARLAADIRQYSNKISRDFEEKEKLSVESDLWKSKFLASSVIVDELARWKGTLMQRNDDCDHYIRLMLHEHSVLWNSLSQTQEMLLKLKHAFDPLNSMENTISKEIEAASILGISDLSLATVQDLRDRLLGTTQLKTYHSKEVSLPKQLDTPAEEGMKNLLVQKSAISTSEFISDRASMALTGAAKPYLTKLSDQASASRNDFKCCTHCQGRSIHIV